MSTSPSTPQQPVVDVHVIVRNGEKILLSQRGGPYGYGQWHAPSGKLDPGETPAEAAAREAREEVALELDPASLDELFEVVAQAHGEPAGRLVRMRVFEAKTDASPQAAAEVGALHWVTTAELDRCPPAGAEVLRRLAAAGRID